MTSSRPFPERSNKRDQPDLLIIGGGASGLAAACILAQNKAPFLLLEKEKKPGRKLLATGNGRCNLINTGEPVYFGEAGFARETLKNCGLKEVGAFFESIGLSYFEEELGRCYPLSRQAQSVLDALTACISAFPGAQVRTECEVTGIKKAGDGFEVLSNQGRFFADKVLLSAGSPAAPKLGGTDSLLPCLLDLGLKAEPFAPALCALLTDTGDTRTFSGLRVPATLSLFVNGRLTDAAAGEALFTDYGVSGLCAMQLARAADEGLRQKKDVSLSLDFSALLGLRPPLYRRLDKGEAQSPDEKMLTNLLNDRIKRLGRERLFTGLLPQQMAAKLRDKRVPEAVSFLLGLKLKVKGVKGFDQAQVASGGLLCSQFDPHTLEAGPVPGLYVSGEILNVDGDTGGFNLLFAWATGILAAGSLASFYRNAGG